MKFLQVHVFYDRYLADLYELRNPHLKTASFADQSLALVKDSFSGVHIIAPYVDSIGWEGTLLVANNPFSQVRWWQEHKSQSPPENLSFEQILHAQIEHYQPDILYLTEPIRFSSEFIRSLSTRPRLVMGWRAANIPEGTDWTEFDIILSSLRGVREAAVTLGAKSASHFWPAFPEWLVQELEPVEATDDLMFCGQWTLDQHPRRNDFLDRIAQLSGETGAFSCAYYMSGQLDTLSSAVAQCNRESRFGLGMMHALRGARIAFDARGNIGIPGASVGKKWAY